MKLPLTLLPLSLLASPALAQTWEIQPLVLVGDVVTGVGSVTQIRDIAINNGQDWRVEVDTNAPSASDLVVLGPAGATLQKGQTLPLPGGATIRRFDSLNLDVHGNTASVISLDGTIGTGDDTGVYRNTALLAQEGSPTTAGAFSPGTPYRILYNVKLADNGDVLVMASVDDPALSSTTDQVLMRLATTPGGALASETALWKEGDLIPGTTAQITSFATGAHRFDVNDSGAAIFFADTTLPSGNDGFILLDGLVLAQEGQPAPVAGRSWQGLGDPETTLNNLGGYAYSGVLDGDFTTNTLIVKSGATFRQEGDPVPGLPAFSLTGFGTGPLDLADTGELLWFGNWDDPDQAIDEGLFVEDLLVVQEGVTLVGGQVIQTLRGDEDQYAISDDGHYVIFEAELADGTSGAFLATRPAGVAVIPGCFAEEGSLTVVSGLPTQGTTMQLRYSNPSPTTGVRKLGLSGVSWAGPTGCGVFVPGIGELLIGILPQDLLLLPAGVHTGADAVLPLPISSDPAFLGITLYLQGVYLFPSDPLDQVDLTNAVAITISA
ncbi:MAG: hypothetical protein P1V81_13750 [Planctomycetota bacterium]|nr:hypothetical protein [Planctomycetota bacterium]